MKKWFKNTPDSLVIVGFILVLTAGLTWVVKPAEYGRHSVSVNGKERTVVNPEVFEEVERSGQGFWDILMAPLKGFMGSGEFHGAVEIVAFVLLVGGAFTMLTETGAIDAFLFRILGIARRRPKSRYGIIALLMVLFSFCGTSFGMSEETLVFVLITLPMARSMGYDNIVGIAIPFIGAGMGFAGATVNPFTVGIAQGIAEVQLFSGFGYRALLWVAFTLIGILFVIAYCRRLEQGKIKPVLSKNQEKIKRSMKSL